MRGTWKRGDITAPRRDWRAGPGPTDFHSGLILGFLWRIIQFVARKSTEGLAIDHALFLVVSFLSSVVGAICGIGGGVIIKPVLDVLGLASVPTISFLSGCTVLSMSCYSVGRSMASGDRSVELSTGTPLAVGAAVGGVVGKQLFEAVKGMSANPDAVGGIQAVCLGILTVGTLAYTLRKAQVEPRRISGVAPCLAIGFSLGLLSSFLGIGGGPFNLVFLHFFFGMETKVAAANSLYIILFSQVTSLVTTLATGSVPPFELAALVLMVTGGISGGVVGRIANHRLDNEAVDRLFMGLMVAIILACCWNSYHYLLLG